MQRTLTKTWTMTSVITAIAMIVFFLLCRSIISQYINGLHFVNILFLTAAIWYITKKHVGYNPEYPYLSGLFIGLKTAALASLLTSFFILIDLRFIDPASMHYLSTRVPLGEYMNPMIIALVFFTEEVCASLVISLIVMQLYKSKKKPS
jgi:hypothetical protein